MNLTNYKKRHDLNENELRERTIVFLIKENEVLLGKRKEGMGEGNYVGIGGKVENECRKTCAARELQEEICVRVEEEDFVPIGELIFLFEDNLDYNQKVILFFSEKWSGIPKETDEILPEWFDFSKIPYSQMWEDAMYYMPFILKRKFVEAEFLYKGKGVVDLRFETVG